MIASRHAYDDPGRVFSKKDVWSGVQIERVSNTAFGKKSRWRRALDFASFIVSCSWRLLFMRKPEVVVALTSPPLISFIGALYAKLRGIKLVYWVMDLNPDEAIAAGWLREGSLAARFLQSLSVYSLRNAARVIALDRFMQMRITAKGIAPEKIAIIPPWSHDEEVRFDATGRQRFRNCHGLDGKFVVMYSGNHSPCHPLDTLLDAARALASDPQVVFLFVGGGSEHSRVKRIAAKEKLGNILCLPYQPLSELSASLSAADLHTVVMGNPFVGLIHPCKIYNILSVRAPLLCIGPKPSHLTEIIQALASAVCVTVDHDDTVGCVDAINQIRQVGRRGEESCYAPVAAAFAQSRLMPCLVDVLERA